VGSDGEINIGRVETNSNPLFLSQNGKASAAPAGGAGGGASLSADALERQVEPPSEALWQIYRAEFLELQRAFAATQANLAAARKAAAIGNAADGVDTPTVGPASGGGGGGAAAAGLARHKAEFKPTGAAGAMVARAAGAKKSLKALRSDAV